MTCISFLGYLYSEKSEEHISDLRKQAKSEYWRIPDNMVRICISNLEKQFALFLREKGATVN